MANTEKLKIIKTIRVSKKTVQMERYSDVTPDNVKVQLEELYSILDKLEDNLILEEIEDQVQSLEETSERLIVISEEIKATCEQLEELAGKIEKVGKALSKLIDFAAKIKDLL